MTTYFSGPLVTIQVKWSEFDYTYCFLNLAKIDLDQWRLTLQQLGHISLK